MLEVAGSYTAEAVEGKPDNQEVGRVGRLAEHHSYRAEVVGAAKVDRSEVDKSKGRVEEMAEQIRSYLAFLISN